ncbi:MAG: ABC transporter substrate-binding protein [Candidatus Latescibacterota bacterium]
MFLLKTTIRLIALALLIPAGFSCGSGDKPSESPTAGRNYTRIVSLAPNITETLFALGIGDRVTGVTRFCTYPPEAREKPQVGGYLDINYEALAALRPDLVILLPEHEEIRKKLEGLDIYTMTVHNRVIRDILDTIHAIGDTCGVSARADSLARDMETRMEAVRKRTKGLPKPRVLIVIERKVGGGTPGAVYAAGPNTSFDELIRLAGGTNAYRGPEISYPEISVEGIIRLDPEVIIDIIPALAAQGITEERARSDWKKLSTISAVKTDRIYILSDNSLVIPGPRFIKALENLAEIIHAPMICQ